MRIKFERSKRVREPTAAIKRITFLWFQLFISENNIGRRDCHYRVREFRLPPHRVYIFVILIHDLIPTTQTSYVFLSHTGVTAPAATFVVNFRGFHLTQPGVEGRNY